ncbi:HD domain-containing protein [Neolewinella agarilytica]|nr:HD domain-containing protein [Neolewinella agarilytica]
MTQRPSSLSYRAGRYVARLLITELPRDRLYHNLHHTINVLQGVLVIGRAEGVSPEEMEILQLAAWFHDCGHVKIYSGHELASMDIARKYLLTQDFPDAKITTVERCILATQMPQEPTDLLEEIICDADMYHLALPTYEQSQELLREEWNLVLGKAYTDEAWESENRKFLKDHHYFTTYGREVLQPMKDIYCF